MPNSSASPAEYVGWEGQKWTTHTIRADLGGWFGQNIMKDAKQAFQYSAERYLAAISE
jgi:hypothetical protein